MAGASKHSRQGVKESITLCGPKDMRVPRSLLDPLKSLSETTDLVGGVQGSGSSVGAVMQVSMAIMSHTYMISPQIALS